jgi:hypothetical protein
MSLGERPLRLISEFSKPLTRPDWRLSIPHVNKLEFYACYRWVLDTHVRNLYPTSYVNHVSFEGYWTKYNSIVWYEQTCKICDYELIYNSINQYINYNGYCHECHDYIYYR